jgi:tripartite-type tricarboxylate transporter receptor subunit TctC
VKHAPLHRRHALAALAAPILASLLAAAPPPARAQASDTWPSRPITLVVASAAGSGVDLVAREMAQQLSTVFRQPVVVENKPGGSGSLAGSMVARARPDGYTLLYSNASFVAVAPAVLRKMSYDPARDLTPIAQTAAGGILLLASKAVPANNLSELLALVKAHPERYSFGTWGMGSSGHLTMAWLMQRAGLKMTHIPYKSTPQIVNELVSGVLQIGWSDPGTPVPMLEAGQVKGIAISGNVRVPRTPQIATLGEQGHPFDAVGWFGVFGPANLPPAITERLHAEINRIQRSPQTRKRMESLNFEPPPARSIAEFRATIARDQALWATIAKDAGISEEP